MQYCCRLPNHSLEDSRQLTQAVTFVTAFWIKEKQVEVDWDNGSIETGDVIVSIFSAAVGSVPR